MRRSAKVLLGGGVLVGVAGLLWGPMVVPKVVKLPTNIDRTDHYAGSFVTFVDQKTGTKLATSSIAGLTIDRHVARVEGQSTGQVALLKETLTAHIGGQSLVEENVFAVNRRTMQNVADARAYTFTPGNVVDRSGTYYLTLPMGVASSGETLSMFKPEGSASYPLISTTPATGTEGGTNVVYLQGEISKPMPVSAPELAALEARGLPTELTPDQSKAQLNAAGIDVAALAPVLVQNLNATELKAVIDALALPLPLSYSVYGSGRVGVEPKTGSIVSLSGIVDGIAVKADMSGMAPAMAALKQHADVPEIGALVATLTTMAAAPEQPAFEMRYTQTPESVTAAGAYARSQADRLTMASSTIPTALTVLGAALMLLGFALVWFPRPRRSNAAPIVSLPLAVRHAS